MVSRRTAVIVGNANRLTVKPPGKGSLEDRENIIKI
jgi:hypothetical protein